MRSRLLVLVSLAFACLALLAGCGGGGSSSTTETEAKKPKVEETAKLSKAAFIRQGDEVCAEVNTAVAAAGESEAEAATQTTQIANLYVGMVQSLQGLGQPAETAGYSEFMGAAEELAKTEGEVKTAAEKNNLELLEEASQEAVPVVEEFQSQAATYGFNDCSEAPHAAVAAPEAGGVAPEETLGEEAGGVAPEEEFLPEEAAPEEEVVPEEEAIEEVAPEEEEPGEVEEVAPEAETAPPTGESGGIGPG